MKKKKAVPPADIILDLINEEPGTDNLILDFYDNYIIAASKEAKYGKNGEYIGSILNCDLAQEIRLAVYRCLPSLRKAFNKRFFRKKPLIILISSK